MAAKDQELDVLESWEEIEEADVLEQKLRNLIPPNNVTMQNNTNNCNGTTAAFNIILTGDDALRSQYVPPEPTVKILKRPTKDLPNNDNKTVQPKKSLQQREQEYAQARLRILGQAHSLEKTESEKICCIQSKPATRPVECENLLRHPKGPDGTKGFKVRR